MWRGGSVLGRGGLIRMFLSIKNERNENEQGTCLSFCVYFNNNTKKKVSFDVFSQFLSFVCTFFKRTSTRQFFADVSSSQFRSFFFASFEIPKRHGGGDRALHPPPFSFPPNK